MTTLPRKFTTIHHILLAALTALLTCGCSDMIDEANSTVLPAERSALTLTLSTEDAITVDATSRAADGSEANEGDPEFYIGETHLFFYPTNATDVASVYSYTFEADAYTTRSVTFKLSDGVISKLFGDDGTECYVYALSNLPRGVKLGSNPTVAELKAITLNTDFTDSDALTDFVMDGFSTITLNRNSWTMSGNITLLRAAAKITLDISIKDEIVTDAGETFRPIIDDDHKIVATLYNAAATGLVGGAATDPTRLTDYKMEYAQNGTTTLGDGDDEDTYDVYSHSAFYTYPATWGDDDNNSDLHITLAISWQKTDVNGDEHFVTYNYQVPVNIAYKTIERNHHYKISLKVGVLSGELEGNDNTFDSDDISYEIADWTNDGTTINAVLTRSHYVVVHDNVFSLYGSSTQTIQYQTCHEARAYLVSVCFNATRYDNQLAYLYNTTFDEATQTYTEVDADGYSELDQKLREKYASVPEYIAANYTPGTSCNMLTNNAVYDESSDDNIGTITFNADINSTASMVFRPLTYTIAILNTPDHMSGRQLITITQYPSKYVEYGAGGNTFVNGYYSHIFPDDGYSDDDLTEGSILNGGNGYRSLNFTYNDYDATTGSYTSDSDEWVGNTTIFGASIFNNSDNMVTTSYEYLQGAWTTWSETDFKFTIDVHVTAFSKNDHTYKYNTSANDAETHSYQLGDPRINANFDNDAHVTGEYVNDNTLYDYLVSGSTRVDADGVTHYDRKVNPWPNVDKIKIGGTTSDYDNIISPLYKIQSTYGNARSALKFDVAQKRCATYQESGYPAGRWRLPTLAEIAFIITLQENDAISRYFNSNVSTIRAGSGGYWTSSGGRVIPPSTSRDYTHYTPNYKDQLVANKASTAWVRCVYDLWYWGTEQSTPTHKYYPEPTL